MTSPLISVIIPVWNEAENLKRLLPQLSKLADLEIIVSDGGSTDDGYSFAQRQLGERAIQPGRPRSRQLNEGAKLAQGEILFFLHADSWLSEGWFKEILSLLSNPEVMLGAFRFAVKSEEFRFRILEWGVNLRSRAFSLPYGDQGLFLRKKDFWALGGFADQPIMEDYLLVEDAGKLGRIVTSAMPLMTSSRRWEKTGILKAAWINRRIVATYKKGGDFLKMRALYDRVRRP